MYRRLKKLKPVGRWFLKWFDYGKNNGCEVVICRFMMIHEEVYILECCCECFAVRLDEVVVAAYWGDVGVLL